MFGVVRSRPEAAPAMAEPSTSSCPSHRRTYAEIDLAAIRHNLRAIRAHLGPAPRLFPVIKSDAYGHGMLPVGRALLQAGADGIAVATSDEALCLRETDGFRDVPLLVMGPSEPAEARLLQAAEVAYSVGIPSLLEDSIKEAHRRGKAPLLHVQIDTGIGRDGFRFDDMRFLDMLGSVPLAGLWTHYSVSDGMTEEERAFTGLQTMRFGEVLAAAQQAGHHPLAHAANSGAILRHTGIGFDMVRPGMMIYGVDPAGPNLNPPVPIRPALTLRSTLASVRPIQPGDGISYGRTWKASQATRIGIVPIGYGDGYIRSLSNKFFVLWRGKRLPIRGRVCMDQFMVDLADAPEAREGDPVVLYGEQDGGRLSLEEAADVAGTIPYELGCILTRRVPRAYINAEPAPDETGSGA